MKEDWIYALVSFVALLFVQVLICNHIHLFGYATPLLYVYLVLPARRNTPKWFILLLSFALGLGVDIFSNTPGIAAASMTLVGFMQPYVLMLFIAYDAPEDIKPSFKTLGIAKYMLYTFILVFIHCLVFFSLELFNFYNTTQWLISIGASTVLTLLLVWVIENLRR